MAHPSLLPAVCLTAFVIAGRSAEAQVAASLDAGAATVRFDGYLRSSVVSVTPAVRYDQSMYRLIARGTGSFFESGNHSLDLLAGGSVYTRAAGSWRGEAGGTGSITLYEGSRTGNAEAELRAHRVGSGRGLWIGTGAGIVTGATEHQGAWTLDAGFWVQRSGVTAATTATHTAFSGARYTDANGSLRWTYGSLEAGGRAGFRAGDDVGGIRGWGDVEALVWLTGHVAITGGWGAYPSDPTRGSPGGHYAAASVRIAARPPRLSDLFDRSGRYAPPPAARPVVASFTVENLDGDRRRILITATGARSVELGSDFTNWNARSFERTPDGKWALEIEIAAGAYFFNVRVDGAPWGTPPGVPVVKDDFGGYVGLLLIR